MSALLEIEPDDGRVDHRLDELIPRPAGPGCRLGVGSALVGLAVGFTILLIGGYLYPRPTFGGSFESGTILEVDPIQQTVTATVEMPNYGQRLVRITAVDLDAPGAELIEVGVMVEASESSADQLQDGGEDQPADEIGPYGPGAVTVEDLPVDVGPGQTARLVLRFRPTDCVDHPGPWGVAIVTVDFGSGGLPPFSNTFRLDQDPIAFVDPDSTETLMWVAEGDLRSVSGPLAGACEALR